MTTSPQAVDHASRRLVVPLPQPYDRAREEFERLAPPPDLARFGQLGTWDAVVQLAEINAPLGFMTYSRIDVSALMAGSGAGWKATEYLMGNHVIAERMFRFDPSVVLHAPLRVLLHADADGDTQFVVDQPSLLFASYGNDDIAAVGSELDGLLAALLRALGATVPSALR